MAHDYPTIRRALFDPESLPGMTVLIHKQPDNIWRIDYQIDDDTNEDEALREDEIRAKVSAVLNDIGYDGPWELEWWSIYSANTLALDDYRDGRIFFVGDSAHIVPIFGVRGLNKRARRRGQYRMETWLGVTGQRPARPCLTAIRQNGAAPRWMFLRNASKSARFMTPNTHGWKLMRDAALVIGADPPVRRRTCEPASDDGLYL